MASTKTRPQVSTSPTAALAARVKLAREHAASHTAQQGIARWTSGNSMVEMEIAALLMPASQVNWHAQAQRDFKAWLQQGGFAGEAQRRSAEEHQGQAAEAIAARNIEATALPAAAPTSLRDHLRGIEILS